MAIVYDLLIESPSGEIIDYKILTMKKLPVLLLTILALAVFAPVTLHAGGKATPTPFIAHHTVIGSISSDSITVNTNSGSKTYKITKFTSCSFEGKTVTVNDLKPGMKVSVVADSSGAAEVITASKPPKAEPASSPKKK